MTPPHPEHDFDTELARLHIKRQHAEPERRLLLLGAALTLAGLVLLFIALAGTRQAATLQQQVDDLALAPLGLGVTLTGAALWLRYSISLYLRFWLIRLIYEDRRTAERILAAAPRRDHTGEPPDADA
jgi:hypothetical protein